MALIIYTNGDKAFKPDVEAVKLWRILDGQAKPENEAQRRYIAHVRRTVKSVSLDYRTAPEDYIRKNLHKLLPKILSEWVVNQHGEPLKPADAQQWTFAKKFGLWRGNKPSAIVAGQLTLI